MALVAGYQEDLFISYARVDNATPDPGKDGWVDLFQRHLEVEIARQIGRAGLVKVWRDVREVGGARRFDTTIENALGGSAVFLALYSQGFVQSRYCNQELEKFATVARSQAAGDTVGGDRKRVIHVLLKDIPAQDWPEALSGATGFPFFEDAHDGDTDRAMSSDDPAFGRRVHRLVQELVAVLQAFPKEDPAPAAVDQDASPSQVYLAAVSDSARTWQQRLTSDLNELGISARADIPPPYEGADHDDALRDALERVKLSVHLLDHLPGTPYAADTNTTYPQHQVDLAEAAGKRQLIWVPDDLDIATLEDERYRDRLLELEQGERSSDEYVFVRGPRTGVAREIKSMLDKLALVGNKARPPAVLLDTHVNDQMLAWEMSQLLLQQNIQPYVNPEESDPREQSTVLEHRLKQVQALLVFFGNVSRQWVEARLGQAINIAVANGLPLKACGVVIAPPNRPDGNRFGPPMLQVHVLDNSQDLNPASLQPILQELGVA